jgi:anti-sigma regulatory factor (Ser/Thr protein kinase)
MAERIAAFDWTANPLGPQERWAASLRLMVSAAIRTRFPMLVFWGPDLIQAYNDAFVPILGRRHPAALGQPARECWPEIWDTIGPMLTGVFETGEPVWFEDLPLILERNGYPEQTHFTFSYSRIGEPGEAGGVLCTCVETTASVLREHAFRELADREHRGYAAFQSAALPRSLPNVPGLALDATYQAAEEGALIGGDWYDVFRLPDGRVVVSVGDVAGSGLDASVTMAAARQAIRGAAFVHPDPAAVLDAADRTLRSEQPDRIITAFVGIIDPLALTFDYASAGHPPPLVRQPDGVVEELAVIPDLPLGLRNERHQGRNSKTLLVDGMMLTLYTDGLTESTRDISAGEARLRRMLASSQVLDDPHPAQALCRLVLTPDEGAARRSYDDVAVLTVAVSAPSRLITRWQFQARDATFAMRVRRELTEMLRSMNASEREVGDAEIAFGELLGNVVRHTDGIVDAALDLSGDEPVLHLLDRGPGFTYHARLPNDAMSENGRGLFIVSQLVREVSVQPRPDGVGSHARVVLAAPNRRIGKRTNLHPAPTR